MIYACEGASDGGEAGLQEASLCWFYEPHRCGRLSPGVNEAPPPTLHPHPRVHLEIQIINISYILRRLEERNFWKRQHNPFPEVRTSLWAYIIRWAAEVVQGASRSFAPACKPNLLRPSVPSHFLSAIWTDRSWTHDLIGALVPCQWTRLFGHANIKHMYT